MLLDRYPVEEVVARVPELAAPPDPVLRHRDPRLDDDPLYQVVRADWVRRSPPTAKHGRHATPAAAILRLLVVKELCNWGWAETAARVADSLVLRWCCRVCCQRVPDATTLLRWARTIQPASLQALRDRVGVLAHRLTVTKGRRRRLDGTVVQTTSQQPPDASLLTEGVRVRSRILRRSKPLVGEQLGGVRAACRRRLRTLRRGLQTLQRRARQQGAAVAAARKDL
jgi:hypothetical protein